MADAKLPVVAIATGTFILGLAAGAVLTLALGALLGGDEQAAEQQGGGPPPAVVEAEPVRVGPLPISYETLGTLRAAERVELRPIESGQVTTIGFADGELVAAGQLLLELESGRERAALPAAEALLTESRRQLALAESLVAKGRGTTNEVERLRNEVAAAEARVAEAEAELDRRRLVAPFAGRVTRKLVSVGASIDTGDPVGVLTAVDPLRVSAGIPETYLGLLTTDLELEASTPAFPGKTFGGRVVYVSPEVDRATRSVLTEAEIDNPEGLLRPGQSLTVTATVGSIDHALSVPEQALILEGNRTSVYVVVEGKALRRDVEIGERGGGRAVVTDGLGEGEMVVTTGIQKIFFPGMPVNVRNQAPAAEAGTEADATAAAPGAE